MHFVLTGKLPPELGRFYSRLFSKRSTGDYEDFVNHSRETVDELLPSAKLFVKSIDILIEKWLASQKPCQN